MAEGEKKAFRVDEHSLTDKHFPVYGPGDLIFHVDYDDVFHDEVDELVKVAVIALNQVPQSVWDEAIRRAAGEEDQVDDA